MNKDAQKIRFIKRLSIQLFGFLVIIVGSIMNNLVVEGLGFAIAIVGLFLMYKAWKSD